MIRPILDGYLPCGQCSAYIPRSGCRHWRPTMTPRAARGQRHRANQEARGCRPHGGGKIAKQLSMTEKAIRAREARAMAREQREASRAAVLAALGLSSADIIVRLSPPLKEEL